MVRVDLSKQRYGLFLNVANFRGGKTKRTALLSEKPAHIFLLINTLNHPVNTIRMSADTIRLSADTIRLSADTIKKPADSLIVFFCPVGPVGPVGQIGHVGPIRFSSKRPLSCLSFIE